MLRYRLVGGTICLLLAITIICIDVGLSCSNNGTKEPVQPGDGSSGDGTGNGTANVVAVSATGTPGNYTFSVGIESDDTSCSQYANWWEVLSADGQLIYRRILAHSHVGEQPFTRSGGPVDVAADDSLIIRAHIHRSGGDDSYGGAEFIGSVASGFAQAGELSIVEATVESAAPQPTGCAF